MNADILMIKCPDCKHWLTREEAEERGLVYVLGTKP